MNVMAPCIKYLMLDFILKVAAIEHNYMLLILDNIPQFMIVLKKFREKLLKVLGHYNEDWTVKIEILFLKKFITRMSWLVFFRKIPIWFQRLNRKNFDES